MASAEWVIRAEERAENGRKFDGVLAVEDFLWMHLPCGKSVVRENMGTVNSTETDPSSGDPKPIFRSRLHCNRDNVSSAVEEFQGK